MDYAYESFVNDLAIEKCAMEATSFSSIAAAIKNIFDKFIQFVKLSIQKIILFVSRMIAIRKSEKLMKVSASKSSINVGSGLDKSSKNITFDKLTSEIFDIVDKNLRNKISFITTLPGMSLSLDYEGNLTFESIEYKGLELYRYIGKLYDEYEASEGEFKIVICLYSNHFQPFCR